MNNKLVRIRIINWFNKYNNNRNYNKKKKIKYKRIFQLINHNKPNKINK